MLKINRILRQKNPVAFLIMLASLMFFNSVALAQKIKDDVSFYFLKPATSWYEAIPIGNGRIGGMVWGGLNREVINLNESTLWSGELVDNQNHTGIKYLSKIRELINQDRNKEVENLFVSSTVNGKCVIYSVNAFKVKSLSTKSTQKNGFFELEFYTEKGKVYEFSPV